MCQIVIPAHGRGDIYKCSASEGGYNNAQNFSAEKETCQDGTRFPQKNVHKKREKGLSPPQGQGQETFVLLILVFRRTEKGAKADIAQPK